MTKALEVIMGLESDSRYHIVKPFIYFSYNDQISNRIHINVDEIVDWVELDLNPIELSQVISKFGEPDYLFFGIDSGVCVVNLLYPNTGIYFQGNCKASIVGDYWTISPNTKLYSVYFLEPQKQVDDLLLRFFGDDLGIAMKDAIRPWAGYGKYSIYP